MDTGVEYQSINKHLTFEFNENYGHSWLYIYVCVCIDL